MISKVTSAPLQEVGTELGPMIDCVQAKKNIYYWFVSDDNLHTYAKSKIKWGNNHIFFIFFIENELFTENVKRGSVVTNRMFELFNLHLIIISIEAEFRALHNYKEFSSKFILVFEVHIFCQKKIIFA